MARKPEKSLASGPQKGKRGFPPVLQPTAETMKTVRGLGSIMATTKECAAVLGVSEPTFLKFMKDNPEVHAAMEEEQGKRLASLRRRQIEIAEKGNLGALIWLGKQYMGQRDKADVAIDARIEMGGAAAALNARLDRALGIAAADQPAGTPEGDKS